VGLGGIGDWSGLFNDPSEQELRLLRDRTWQIVNSMPLERVTAKKSDAAEENLGGAAFACGSLLVGECGGI
jgi:hypothetical protein